MFSQYLGIFEKSNQENLIIIEGKRENLFGQALKKSIIIIFCDIIYVFTIMFSVHMILKCDKNI